MENHSESQQNKKSASFKKVLVYGILSCLVLGLVLFISVCWTIRTSVKEMCVVAVKEYPSDRVEALIAYASSEKHSLKKRNRAVWALGQIGDERALPMLESFYTGKDCDHEKDLCQRELSHAIYGCKGGLNLTAWLPR